LGCNLPPLRIAVSNCRRLPRDPPSSRFLDSDLCYASPKETAFLAQAHDAHGR
jgi:hypothetical protein